MKISIPKFSSISALLLSCFSLVNTDTNAQMVGTNIYLKGQTIEVGVHNLGFCGSSVAPPAGYHARPASRLGFVADPLLDGWLVGTPDYIGDYFIPGTPHEGWDIQFNGNQNRAWGLTSSFTAVGGPLLLTGSNIAYIEDGRDKIALWQGTMGDLAITRRTIVDTTKTYFLVEVELENTGTTTLNDIYYGRTVDPDNEERVAGGSSFTTTNAIVYQPGDAGTTFEDRNKCLVTATGLNYPSVSYLGLGTMDCRAKVYIYPSALNPDRQSSAIYDDMPSPYIMNKGGSNTADCGIGLIFSLGDLEPGAKANFAYAYILRAEDLDSAFKRISASLNINGGEYASSDTVYACPNSWVDISIDGGNDYDWSSGWFPTDGLENPDGGSTNRVFVTDTITYTIIGENLICEDYDTITITIIPRNVGNPGVDTAITLCNNAPPINLFEYLGGTPELGGVWTGPGVSPLGVIEPTSMAGGLYEFVYNQTVDTCHAEATLTVEIINDVDLDFTMTYNFGCDQDTVHFNNTSTDLTYFRWNFGDGVTDTLNFNPSHIYEDQAVYNVWLIGINSLGCLDSVMKFVDVTHPLDAIYEQSGDTICQHFANTVAFYDRSVGDIAEWNWDFGDGSPISNDQNPTHTYTTAGTFNITLIIKDVVGCYDTAYSTIFVEASPSIDVEINKEEICNGEQVRVDIETVGIITNVNWDFGDGVVINNNASYMNHSYDHPGTYIVTVSTTHIVCPNEEAADTILVKPMPMINLGPDTNICLNGEPILLDPTALASNPLGTIYYWSTGDTSHVYTVTEPGIYRIYASAQGCVTSDEIVVGKDCYTDIPNAFTPNGDGDNDYFYPRQLLSKGVVDFKMEIYNRWGEKVFETNNPDGRGWDGKYGGKEQPQGVYVYQISVRYKNQASEKYTGNVTLVR